MQKTILAVTSSSRGSESVTDRLIDELISTIADAETTVVRRRLDRTLPLLSPAVTAELTLDAGERSFDATAALAVADHLIAELAEADVVVIAAPVYNFGVPAVLKAWADLVARAGTTFAYSETGPVGLLEDRPTYIVAASGGTEIGSEIDFGTTWLRHFLGFLGISDVTVIAANQLAVDAEAGFDAARRQIAATAMAEQAA